MLSLPREIREIIAAQRPAFGRLSKSMLCDMVSAMSRYGTREIIRAIDIMIDGELRNVRHSLNGPASFFTNGQRSHSCYGELHNSRGPAVYFQNCDLARYWIMSYQLSEKEFKEVMNDPELTLTIANFEDTGFYPVDTVKRLFAAHGVM